MINSLITELRPESMPLPRQLMPQSFGRRSLGPYLGPAGAAMVEMARNERPEIIVARGNIVLFGGFDVLLFADEAGGWMPL